MTTPRMDKGETEKGSETNDITNITTEDGGYTNPEFAIELEVNGTKNQQNKSQLSNGDSKETTPKFRRKVSNFHCYRWYIILAIGFYTVVKKYPN